LRVPIAEPTGARWRPSSALLVAAAYTAIAALWIVVSDRVLERGAPVGTGAWTVATVKGVAFVSLTGAALYVVLRSARRRERETARRLEASERHYRAAVEGTPESVLVVRADGTIAYANPGAALLFGAREAGELPGRPLAELLHPAERLGAPPGAAAPVKQLVRMRRLDGGALLADVAVRPYLLAAEGSLLVSIRDVTAPMRLQEELARVNGALRAEREFLGSMLDNAGALVGIVDAEGRLARVNREFERLTGWATHELVGQPLSERLPPEDREPVSQALARALATGAPVTLTNVLVTKDGGRRTVEWINTVIRDEHGRPYVVGIGRDVTEWREAQRSLAESREQLRALAARIQGVREEEKARIARDLHDELGQLVTGLKMDLRWIERRIGELAESDAAHALLDRAVAASELADQTVASVQRLAADLRPGALDRLGLGAALRQEGRAFEARTGVRCEVELDEGLPPLSDDLATALYRIAQEAMTNVARHAAARRVRVQLGRADGAAVRLRVEDDGRGIAPRDATRPDALGLLGMRERANALHGAVRIAAAPGGGTVVTAELPLDAERELA
jgi:PAS domain S-box-containing protein